MLKKQFQEDWLRDLCPMVFLAGTSTASPVRLGPFKSFWQICWIFLCQDGITRISGFSEQLACIKQHASHSHVAVFPFAESSHVSSGWRCFADTSMRNGHEKEIDLLNLLKHLLHSGNEDEEKNESDKDSYLAVVLLLRVRSCQFNMSLSGRLERSAWAKVQDVSMGRTPTSAATRLQALHHSAFFLHIGAVTVLRSKTNLIEALTNYPWKDRYCQFHPLQCYLWPMLWGVRHTCTHHHQDTQYTVHGPNLCNLTLLGFVKFLFCVSSWRAKPRCTSAVRTSMDSPTSPELILESPTQDEPTEHHTTATHGCGRTSSALVVLHFCIFSGGMPWWESDRASKSEKVSAKLFWRAKHQIWKAGVKDPPAKRNVGGVSLLYISSPSFWETSSCWTCSLATDVRAKLQTAGEDIRKNSLHRWHNIEECFV